MLTYNYNVCSFDSNYQVGRVFASGLGDLGLIPGCVIPNTLKMELDTSLLYIQRYKVRIKGKVERSRERSSALHLGVVAIEKGAFWSPSTMAVNFTYLLILIPKWRQILWCIFLLIPEEMTSYTLL